MQKNVPLVRSIFWCTGRLSINFQRFAMVKIGADKVTKKNCHKVMENGPNQGKILKDIINF